MTRPASSGDRRLKSWASPSLGASPWRLERVEELLKNFTPSLLRVNPGEARALLHLESQSQGVDSPAALDSVQQGNLTLRLSRELKTAVLISGSEDFISNGTVLWKVSGGSSLMTQVTGTGCMLSVLCGVFAAVESDILAAAVTAAAFWKSCSRRAEALAPCQGPGSFRTALLDAAGTLTAADCAGMAFVELLF